MPIPTRSQSVRGSVPPIQGGLRTQSHARKASGDEPEARKSSMTSRGISALPQPRKVGVSGLPRGTAGHIRTQSAAVANKTVTAVPQATSASIGVYARPPSHARVASTDLRSGHSRPHSSVPRVPSQPRPSLNPGPNASQQQLGTQKPRVSTGEEKSTRIASKGEGVSPHLSAIQSELLQLTLVHARSQETLNEYKISANTKLEAEAARLRREYADVTILEQKQQEEVNACSLVQWLGQWTQSEAISQVRKLSLCIQELSDLTDEGGEYARVIREFEAWQADARGFLDRTMQGAKQNVATGISVDKLDSAWLEAVEALRTRLRLCKHALRDCGEADSRSALGQISSAGQQLASTMLEQLELCAKLHSGFLMHQQKYLTETLAAIVSEVEAGQSEAEMLSRKPVWEISQAD